MVNPAQAVDPATDILSGAGAIARFLCRSIPTVMDWKKMYPDMPIYKIDGKWESSRLELAQWRREVLLGKKPPEAEPQKPDRDKKARNSA